MPSIIEHWRRQQTNPALFVNVADHVHVTDHAELNPPTDARLPDILLQAVLKVGDSSKEGQLVVGVAIPWFEIIKELARDPDFLQKVSWRQLEEIVAGAYQREGWRDVILTPRSNDGGRDVIARHPGGFGEIKIIDSVKHFKRGHLVTADDVRAMVGVLNLERNVSKGVVTTSSGFAPGIHKDQDLKALMPSRLELKDGPILAAWLSSLSSRAAE